MRVRSGPTGGNSCCKLLSSDTDELSCMFHILVVDDHEDVAYLFERILKIHGYRVTVACDGPTALDMAVADWPDGVVTDYQMPGMKGTELLEKLRERQADLPAVIVSAYTSDIGLVKGNTRLLSKPIAFDRLIDTVKTVLQPA